MTCSPHEQSTIRPPHPLAVDLAQRLRDAVGALVLDYCTGSGRNAAYLERCGLTVEAIPDSHAVRFDESPSSQRFAGIVSSHGLLHGFTRSMPARVAGLATRLLPAGWMCATFGSTHDARYGLGSRLDAGTYATADGDEAGVAHAYFDEAALRAILQPSFDVVVLQERDAARTAGTWAHATPQAGSVHWFFVGRRASHQRSTDAPA